VPYHAEDVLKIIGKNLQMLPPAGTGASLKTSFDKPHFNTKAKGSAKDEFDNQLKEAARLYEAQFLRQMVKGLRATVPESDLVPKSQGERIFQGMLDEQYADQWAAEGGVGLADMIYRQMREILPKKKAGP
jgi:flagellar protein FlgJ